MRKRQEHMQIGINTCIPAKEGHRDTYIVLYSFRCLTHVRVDIADFDYV